jgi:phosphonate transport system substrate-binding protein
MSFAALRSLLSAAVTVGALGVADVARAEESALPVLGGAPFRLGIVATDRRAADRIEPFRRRLEIALDRNVEIVSTGSGLALARALAEAKVDYAMLSGTAYATAWRLCGCVAPIAVPRSVDGTAGYHAAVVVRASSSIATVKDLKSRTLAVAEETSVAGRMLPLAELASAGVPSTDLAKLVPTAGPAAALALLTDGKVDAAVVWSTLEGSEAGGYSRGTLADAVAKGRLAMSDYRIVWSSSLIAHPPHVIRSSLAEPVKARLRDVLDDLPERDPDAYDAVAGSFGGGFVPVGHAAYVNLLPLVTPPEAAEPTPAEPVKPKT